MQTNEEIMNGLKENGVVSEDEENGSRDYDRGLDTLNAMKSRSKNSIRINNRLFGDLEVELEKEKDQV